MQLNTYGDVYKFSIEQSHAHKLRMMASYCVYHEFPLEVNSFSRRANKTFSLTTDTCGLHYHPSFEIEGLWNRSSTTRRVRTDYPLPPPVKSIEGLLRDERIEVYTQLLAVFFRDNDFITIHESPLLKGLQPIYQVGESCFLAAVLNFVMHVPELRKSVFQAFRLKSAKISSFTLDSFGSLGNFAEEPLGSTLLALGEHIRDRSLKYDDPFLRLGSSRALLRAFMLRIEGFDELDEHVILERRRNPIMPKESDELAFYITSIMKRNFESNPSMRGGILSGGDEKGILIYNWGVGGRWHQVHEFLKMFPKKIEIVMYSLPHVHRHLQFDDIPVKKKRPSLRRRIFGR